MATRGDPRLFGIAAAVVIIAALYFARVVFVPLALAILLALLVAPAVGFLERLRLPRILAISLLCITLVACGGLLLATVATLFFMPVFFSVAHGLHEKESARGAE